ncbi:MAG: hypothetical protein KIS66_08885 [Fimbriimonadaceae bacterium]|nr:hypothetical protein [Fimbriimonadaceae bacterium]
MRIVGNPGRAVFRPLERIEIQSDRAGKWRADSPNGPIAEGELKTPGRFSFVAGGAAGIHRVTMGSRTLRYRLKPETRFDDPTGEFSDLFEATKFTILGSDEVGSAVRYRGRTYEFFVRWLRDHVHVLKGAKYLRGNLKPGIELYRDSQREDGMIWDNVYPRGPLGDTFWDLRFKDGDFIRVEDGFEFKRIPVEADVEYLFVEGVHATWQASGDDGWMASCLDACARALDYCVTSPYRWSTQYGLIKRGYTIDTWDFQVADECTVEGDIMRVHPDKTRFGIMHGDNTGYITACNQLARMLGVAGRAEEGKRFTDRAREMRDRLHKLCWAGGYFLHHVPEDRPLGVKYGVEEATQLSLSNAYSANRDIASDQARAIVETYERLSQNLPDGSPGEWYAIYPPFGEGFGDHATKWQYMNGAVTPIVGGEIARAAFMLGKEAYGVDVLRRLHALARKHGGRFEDFYTGGKLVSQPTVFEPLDLRQLANVDTHGIGAAGVPGWTGEGSNDLSTFPVGDRSFCGIPYSVIDPSANGRRSALGLWNKTGYRTRFELPVGRAVGSLYLLHTMSVNNASGVAGTVTFEYRDGTRHAEYVVRGKNIVHWWDPQTPGPAVGDKRRWDVAWHGPNPAFSNVVVAAAGFDHPHRDKEVTRIVLEASADGAFWGVLGATLSDREVFFDPGPISSGAPDNWAAAAVMYALVEGLAGVLDAIGEFGMAVVRPAWYSAGKDRAEVCIHYPESDGYVAYRYDHDRTGRVVRVTLTGSGEEAMVRVPVPGGARPVACLVDGKQRKFQKLGGVGQEAGVFVRISGTVTVEVTYA